MDPISFSSFIGGIQNIAKEHGQMKQEGESISNLNR
jgi:hypothetical protein